MKISEIQPIIATHPVDTWAIVRITTDNGLTGWGEFSGSSLSNAGAAAVINVLAAGMVGRDPLDIPGCFAQLAAWRYPSHSDFRCVKLAWSALDMALWDIRAQAEGVPLRELLRSGGPPSLPLYANLNRLLRRDRSLDTLVRTARDAARDGFRILKLAPFDEVTPVTPDPDVGAGVERVWAVLDALERTSLSLDCHCRFTPASFGELLRQLGETVSAVDFFEDPVRIHAAGDIGPIWARWPDLRYASGEDCYDVQNLYDLAESGRFCLLNPDLKYTGGVSAAAEYFPKLAARVPLCLHNPSGPIATACSAHVSVLFGGETCLEYAYGGRQARNAFLGDEEPVERGSYHYTDRPGIGVAPSLEFLERYGVPVRP